MVNMKQRGKADGVVLRWEQYTCGVLQVRLRKGSR